jgi:hypothetical protein
VEAAAIRGYSQNPAAVTKPIKRPVKQVAQSFRRELGVETTLLAI